MTPEAQRIAIAEACGWKRAFSTPPDSKFYRSPTGRIDHVVHLPDYLNDLNAMHDVLAVVPENKRHLLIRRLSPNYWTLITTPAAELAEAFLRAMDKWEGE